MTNKTNAITAKIVDYRYIGKTQLNADDMGGLGCTNWDNYLSACNLLATSAWDYTMGKTVNDDAVITCISGLCNFFGISVTDCRAYSARILAVLIDRKANRSDALKDAIKDRTKAKNAWKDAIAENKPEDEIAALKAIHDEKDEIVNNLYAEPHNYWFDPAPMFDKKTKKATAKARKALEDTFADIFTERQFMSADDIQKEELRLADERKGRAIRKKNEAKAEKSAK